MKSKTLKKAISILLCLSMGAVMTAFTASAETTDSEGPTVKIDIPFNGEEDAELFTSGTIKTGTVTEDTTTEDATGWWIYDGQLVYGKKQTNGDVDTSKEYDPKTLVTTAESYGDVFTFVGTDLSTLKNAGYFYFCIGEDGYYRIGLNWVPEFKRLNSSGYTKETFTMTTKYYKNGTEVEKESFTPFGSDSKKALRNTAGETYTLNYDHGRVEFRTKISYNNAVWETVSIYNIDSPLAGGKLGYKGGSNSSAKIKNLAIEYPKVYGYGLTAKKNEGEVTGDFKIGNNMDAVQGAFVVAAGYDIETMTMCDVDVIENLSSVVVSDTDTTKNFSLTGSDIDTVYVYIWDGADTLTPYMTKLEAAAEEAAAE